MSSIAAYDRHVEQLFDVLHRVAKALSDAGIPYRVVGGVAAFLHVHGRDPIRARMTRDIDLAVERGDLERIAAAARPHGFELRHAAGVDMLVDTTGGRPRSAAHLLFVRERVRPDYLEPVPDFSPPVLTPDGLLLAPVADLVRMKLTSFRLKDKVHIQDLDSVGLITPQIEATLSDTLRARLQEIRATE